MAQITLRGNPIHTVGELPGVGSSPDFTLTLGDLSDVTKSSFAGQRVVLNIFPSVDTPTCASSVRRFNVEASRLDNTVVLCVSADLPFAAKRFCGAEGLTNVQTASTFRSDFGASWGIALADSGMRGLLGRAVVVLDGTGKVVHSQLVPEIAQEPDYDSAIAALS
jgi:thioredoxin-dependent peroxiredoxin